MLMVDKEPPVLKRVLLAVFASATLFHAEGLAAQAQPPAPAPPEKIDYSDGKTWLCRPGRQDACAIDLTTTVVAADGTLTRETWTADPKAPIDCFYVYPTVSTDPTPNSDMTADPAELNVVAQQFARFASKCRPYAPLYRQVTLAGLRRMLATARAGARPAASATTTCATRGTTTSQHDNKGRGVVLVGHSQGSFVLAGADSPGDRRQAGPVAARVGDAAGRDVRGAEGQGRRRHVQEHPALPERRRRPAA